MKKKNDTGRFQNYGRGLGPLKKKKNNNKKDFLGGCKNSVALILFRTKQSLNRFYECIEAVRRLQGFTQYVKNVVCKQNHVCLGYSGDYTG